MKTFFDNRGQTGEGDLGLCGESGLTRPERSLVRARGRDVIRVGSELTAEPAEAVEIEMPAAASRSV